MGAHVAAVEELLARVARPSPVAAENLRGLARAWDRIEATGDGIGNVANLSNQMMRVVESLDFDDGGDPWDHLVARLEAGG